MFPEQIDLAYRLDLLIFSWIQFALPQYTLDHRRSVQYLARNYTIENAIDAGDKARSNLIEIDLLLVFVDHLSKDLIVAEADMPFFPRKVKHMINYSVALRMILRDVKHPNQELLYKRHLATFVHGSVERKDVSRPLDGVALESHVTVVYQSLYVKFNRWPFRIPACPQEKVDFLFDFEVEEVPRLVVVAELADLLMHISVTDEVLCFSSLKSFFACGRRANMLSMNCR